MQRINVKSGDRYGMLTVIEELEKIEYQRRILCRCDCGRIKIIRMCHLRNGGSRSCGCLARTNPLKHGLSNHILYSVWCNIKTRCYNPNNNAYKNYGARGIAMCPEWINNFKSFYEWAINSGWHKDLEINRINNDGNYEPLNCEWTNLICQANNKRNIKKYLWEGKYMSLTEVCRLLNIMDRFALIWNRIIVNQWDIKKAIEINFDGRTLRRGNNK